MFKVQNEMSSAEHFLLKSKTIFLEADLTLYLIVWIQFIMGWSTFLTCDLNHGISTDEYKQLSSLNEFKSEIKIWVPKNCSCCLCKRYV